MQTNKNFTEYYKLRSSGVRYIINEDKGVVVAKAAFTLPFMLYYKSGKVVIHGVGIAKVNKEAGSTFAVTSI